MRGGPPGGGVERVSIWIPIDWHAETPPTAELGAGWMAQVPREVADQFPVELIFLGDWRQHRPATKDASRLQSLCKKELRRASITGFDKSIILDEVARFWDAARDRLDRFPAEAILLWNCGNADQQIWTMLAKERGIPVLHVEHGWLPHTRIFDPIGSYVVGRSEWDKICERPADVRVGKAVIERWRKAGLSKHLQGGEPSPEIEEFCRRGPALLVAMQLEADASVVYQETEFDCQLDFLQKCMSWPGPVLVKQHPQAERIEWEPVFYDRRAQCRQEVERRGGLWLGSNESLHGLFSLVSAVAAMNSNVRFEAAMAGKLSIGFGHGPHSRRGFLHEMKTQDAWPEVREQTEDEARAVAIHAARMVEYLTPEGAWLPDWTWEDFWGQELWKEAPKKLMAKWERLLA